MDAAKRSVPEGEGTSVGSEQPVPAGVWSGDDSHDRSVESALSYRAEEIGSKGEDTP